MNAEHAPVPASDGWNPRPDPEGTAWNTRAYMCGYTDGFYGQKFGAHDADQYGAFSAYRPGYSHGVSDRNPELLSNSVAFALISEKARFHRDRVEPDSALAISLGEVADIAKTRLAAIAKARGQ